MIAVMVLLGTGAANSEKKDEFRSQLTTIGLVTSAMIFTLFGITMIYIDSYPDYFRSYVLLAIHLNFLLSFLGVSIATLQQA